MLNINSAQRDNRRIGGSAMAWVLVWLAGISGLVAFSVDRYVPMIESKLTKDVITSLSIGEPSPITVSVQGHQATLAGSVHDDQQRRALLDSAMSTPGIFSVTDELTLKTASVASPSTDDAGSELLAEPEVDDSTMAVATADADAMTGAKQESTGAPNDQTAPAAKAEPQPVSEPDVVAETVAETVPVPEVTESAEDLVQQLANELSLNTALNSTTDALPATSASELVPEPVTETTRVVPEMNLQIRDGVMTINGRMAASDAIDPLLDIARTSLEVNTISNYVVPDENTVAAEWLEPISSLLPALALLEQPGLEIAGDQIVLSGTAPDEDTYDAVVNEALQTLIAFTLVEDIDIADPDAEPVNEAVVEQPVAEQEMPSTNDSASTTAFTSEELKTQAELASRVEAERVAQAERDAEAARVAVATRAAEAEREAQVAAELEAQAEATREAQAAAERESAAEAIRQAKIQADVAAAAEALSEIELEAQAQAELDAQRALEREARQESSTADAGAIDDEPSTIVANDNEALTLARNDSDLESENLTSSRLEERRAALSESMDQLESKRILFRSGQDVLTTRSAGILDQIAIILRRYPDVPIGIDGHTDAAGNRDQNLLLSQRRANAVRDYLTESGVSVFRLSARGFGEELPLVSNNTRRGRAANRRIEFNY